jgi:ParB-like chromosome segregation protein Spo0J
MNLAHRIELWPVERLKPYDRNARTHSPEQVTKIAASLAEFGFTNPILVDSADGIIAGHGRLMAAKELGLADVPVIVLDHLSDAQRRAYVLADNKLAELAGWDVEILADEINWLEHDGYDLTLAGFTDDELTAFIGDGILPEGSNAEETGPAVQPLDSMPALRSGDRDPFQQITFTLHDNQAEIVREAMDASKGMGPFDASENPNSNGNALTRACEIFLLRANG